MQISQAIQKASSHALNELYGHYFEPEQIALTPTKREFEGDFTIVVFPFVKALRQKPEAIAEALGQYLRQHSEDVRDFNVVKGFLNLSVSAKAWQRFLQAAQQQGYGQQPRRGERVMVEFSSPNTNKPLHLGHIRNILLGWSCSRILEKAGYEVVRTQILNDRGIAICKSMLAWRRFGHAESPSSGGLKGDQLVGKYYVMFEKKVAEEYAEWQRSAEAQALFAAEAKPGQDAADFFKAFKNQYFNRYSALGQEAREMLLKWEAGDKDVRQLWKMMNGWVYAGFDATYDKLQVRFDKLYYESDTYLLGKDIVEKGLKKGVFYQKDDGSVWIDLEAEGLDHKLVLRSDGTSVYITQDLGTAELRDADYRMDKMVYVVAYEQDYHFKVLFATLKRLGAHYAEGLYHLSYGLVELPEGRMKTREGTVVDADDLITEVAAEAARTTQELGTLEDLPEAERRRIHQQVGMGALKFFILKVNPRKNMIYNPKESLDLQGQTGPYIQYQAVRCQKVGRDADAQGISRKGAEGYTDYTPMEKELLVLLAAYPETIAQAAQDYDPSAIANYAYALAKAFSRYWAESMVFVRDAPATMAFRIQLTGAVGQVLADALDLLGIEVPAQM